MPKKILRTLKILEVSACDRPANIHAKAVIMKNDTSDTQAARDDAVNTLREKKITDYMEHHGVSRADASAAIGNVAANKAALTAADTVSATISYFAEEHAKRNGMPLTKAQAEFLDTPFGKELYASYDLEKQTPSENLTKAQSDAALVALAKAYQGDGISKWAAMNKALGTRLGRELYRKASEAA